MSDRETSAGPKLDWSRLVGFEADGMIAARLAPKIGGAKQGGAPPPPPPVPPRP